MKKILSLFTFILLLSTSFAQETEGHISYIVDISSDDPEMEMQINMLNGMTMDIYFKDDMSRSEVNMGMMMKMTTISDNQSGEMLMLISGMIGQKAIQKKIPEIIEDDIDEEDVDIQLINETKTIAGFKCKKAIIKTEDGGEMIYWYTKKIKTNVEGNQFLNNKIPGFPMEISMLTEQMNMVFTVDKYEKKVENESELFDLTIPEGYETMTEEDLKNMGM